VTLPWGGSALRLRLRAIRNAAAESLLPVPIAMVAAALALGAALVRVDRAFPHRTLPEWLRISPQAGTELLTTIAGAMVTTAGVVFSLIVVSFQLATSQFTPRVMRGFVRDRLGKVLVGLLASVFAYCVLALQQIPAARPGAEPFVPDLTVNAAVTLTLTAVLVLVAYLHRLSRRHYVGVVIADIARETIAVVRALRREADRARDGPADAPRPAGPPHLVLANRDGWVQQLAIDLLVSALPPDTVLRLETRVGAFVVRGMPIASVWPAPAHPHRVERAVLSALVVGETRTMQQDADFGVRQIADIALRALAPAVNDPTTAVEAVLRLSTIVRAALAGPLPPRVRRGSRGRALLLAEELTHADLVRHAFGEIHVAAAAQPAVALALVRSLVALRTWARAAGREEEPELDHQLALALEACERSQLPEGDLESIRAAAAGPVDPRRPLGAPEAGDGEHGPERGASSGRAGAHAPTGP
jgi:uncharacterized membrane protein